MAKAKKKSANKKSEPKALKGLTPAKKRAVKAWALSQCRVKSAKKKASKKRASKKRK
jgi:hypothetical protein